jgi:hypothetical protein
MLGTDRVVRLSRESSNAGRKGAHPIEVAVSALAVALAQAHEAGDAATVRMLHAVLALLSAAPKTSPH